MRRSHSDAATVPPAGGPASATNPPDSASPAVDDPILERCLERALAPYRPHMTPIALQMLRMELLRFLTTEPAARKRVARARGHLVTRSGDLIPRSSDEDDEEDLGDGDGHAHGG